MNRFLQLLALTYLAIAPSLALASADNGDVIDLILDNKLSWLHTLITAGLLIKLFLVIYDKWEAIFKGEQVISNLLTVGGWMVAAIFWKDILTAVGGFGA